MKPSQLFVNAKKYSDDVYQATAVMLKGIITREISTEKVTNLTDLIEMAPKLSISTSASRNINKMFIDKKIKHLSRTTVTESAKYTLLSLQTSLGIYTINNIAGMIISFQKGPILGLVGRIDNKYCVVDIERGEIRKLEPIVGFVNYIRRYHNASLKTAFTLDILIPNNEISATVSVEASRTTSTQKKTRKRKEQSRVIAPTTVTTTLTRNQRKKQAQAQAKKNAAVVDTQKSLNENEAKHEEEGKEEIEPVKKKGKVSKKAATKEQDATKKKKKIATPDLFDMLTGDVTPTKTRAAKKKKTVK